MDEEKRAQHIEKARDIMRRTKMESRQLESAVILSETLKQQSQQRKENSEIKKANQERKLNEGKEILSQADQWIEQQNLKMFQTKKRNDEFKKDLFLCSQEEQKRRKEELVKKVNLEKKKREIVDDELKAQMEREKQFLEKKKLSMRQNALEAMQMAEQRRLRDVQENAIENQLIQIYAEGKQNISYLKNKKEKEIKEENFKNKNELLEKMAENLPNNDQEEEAYKKAVCELEFKLTEKELQKVAIAKKNKAARIQHYLNEMEQEKKQKIERENEKHWSIANRLKNVEVNLDYDRQKKSEMKAITDQNRFDILKQLEAQNLKEKNQRESDLKFANFHLDKSQDDKQFFNAAEEFIADSKQKGRPILPIKRAVEVYKKDNYLITPKEPAPHLQTNINFGKGCPCDRISSAGFKYGIGELKSLNPLSARKFFY